ncbi:MAG: glycosyltransferase, partial [Cyanobacteria bacterium J06643_5]
MSNFESNGQQKARYSSNNIKMTKYFLSIALCTYNGERYLQEQLNSIAWQNRLPDELVICDDLSCDNTASVVKSFATKVDFPVHFLVNDKNIGSTKNFEKAISLCNGDIIILADQDDIWHPEKLMMIENSFLSSPEVGLVFSDAEIVDNNLSELQYNLWQSIDFNQWEQRYFLKKDKNYIFNFLVKKNAVAPVTTFFLTKKLN